MADVLTKDRWVVYLFLMALAGSSSLGELASRTDESPNILWITTDQQRWDTIGCLNNPHIHTPNLDRLCQQGVAFERAYCQSPICTPSRASFLTGLYPSAIHQNRNGNDTFPASDRVQLITKRLADVGYTCGLSGKLHIAAAWRGTEIRVDDGYKYFWYSHSPGEGMGKGNQYTDWLTQQGIDIKTLFRDYRADDTSYRHYKPDIDEKYHQTTWCTDRALEFINMQHSGPWLMSVNFYDPHLPFDAPAKYSQRYDPKTLPKPIMANNEAAHQKRLSAFFLQREFQQPDDGIQEIRASYYGMIELIDENIGRLLDELKRSGQRDNTVIIFHSDHGELLGDHGFLAKGCRFYEGLTHVPLIVSRPGHFKQNLRSRALVELTDLAPTLAELAGIKLEWTHGKSLLPLLTGKAEAHRRRNFVRCEYYNTLNPFFPHAPEKHKPCYATMYRDDRYKLCVYHGSDYGELFDMDDDPHEINNLWEDPQYRELKYGLITKSFDASIVISDPGPKQIGRY